MRYIDVCFDELTEMNAGEVRAAVIRVLLEEEIDDIDQATAEVMANDVIRSVLQHREREWKTGDIVRDDSGTVWKRFSATHWQKMGHGGMYSHSRPARPLTLIDSPADRKADQRGLASMERARDDGAPI